MEKSYCMRCAKEVEEDTELCSCGGRSFIFGKNIVLGEKGFVCSCSCDSFKLNMHMDFLNKSINNYTCSNCSNVIGIETFRNEDDLFF